MYSNCDLVLVNFMKTLHTISTLVIIHELVIIDELEHSFSHRKSNHFVISLNISQIEDQNLPRYFVLPQRLQTLKIFTCSKSAVETLENCVKYVQS